MALQGEKWRGKLQLQPLFNPDINPLNTVRALHETVVNLRTALERSRSELNLLKLKVPAEDTFSRYSDTIEKLSLENHILRRKFLATKQGKEFTEYVIKNANLPVKGKFHSMADISKETTEELNNKIECEKTEKVESRNIEEDKDSNQITEELTDTRDGLKRSLSQQKTDSEESEEVDDIELIFTTDDTKCISFQEELEPISDDGEVYESKSEINQRGISTQSVLVETDISKCGIVCDVENVSHHISSHRPVLIREDSKTSHRRLSLKRGSLINEDIRVRPIVNKLVLSVRDSEAQTDISALPPCWKSESYLANNKTAGTFTTLPAKFAIPVKDPLLKKGSLKLSQKTNLDARRILLSDINFTSMVPELSRSVDHLCQKGNNAQNISNNSPALKYLKSPLNATCGSSQFNIENSNWDCYDNSFISDNPSAQDLHNGKRIRPSVHSLDACYLSRTSSVPPSPTQRRHSSTASYSPSNYYCDSQFAYSLPLQADSKNCSKGPVIVSKGLGRKQRQKVTFKDSMFKRNMRQSLPNVNVETESEDSTESLITESEECIRKSIDTVVSGYKVLNVGRNRAFRTFSESDLIKEFWPPLSARPFIAKYPSDLHINYYVKVINSDGRIVAGKIQYVGVLPGKTEHYVGIALSTQMGDNDGCYQGHRFFTCGKSCGVFIPFRKVVMAWKI